MGRKSQFEKGIKVKSVLNKHEEYIIVDILKNELKVKALSNGLEFTCKKSLFTLENNLK